MSISRTIGLGAANAVLIGTMTFAGGHNLSPAENSMKARKSHMSLYYHNLGVLGDIAKGNIEFNANMAQGVADNLAALSVMSQMTYWDPDSSSDNLEASNALPAIWARDTDIFAKAEAVAAAAKAMQAAAGTLEGVQANMTPVGAACKACHKDYRKPVN